MSAPVKNARGIECPKCQSARLQIIDTRPGDECTTRRRKCRACGFRFTTIEAVKSDMPFGERNANAIKIDHALAIANRLCQTLEKMRPDHAD